LRKEAQCFDYDAGGTRPDDDRGVGLAHFIAIVSADTLLSLENSRK